MLRYTSMNSSRQGLQTNGKHFSNFELVFEFLAKNWKFFKWIVRREYWSKCNVLYGISIDSSQLVQQTNGKLFFSNFKFVFKLLAENRKIFKWSKWSARREYWSKCNILYINKFVSTSSMNRWKAFFQISESFFDLTTLFLNNSGVVFRHARWGRHLCWSTRVLVSQYTCDFLLYKLFIESM